MLNEEQKNNFASQVIEFCQENSTSVQIFTANEQQGPDKTEPDTLIMKIKLSEKGQKKLKNFGLPLKHFQLKESTLLENLRKQKEKHMQTGRYEK